MSGHRQSRWQSWVDNGRDLGGPATLFLLAPFFALILVIFVYPLGKLMLISVTEPNLTLGNYARVFENSTYALVLVRTLWISLVTTVAALLLGFPVAYLMTRVGPKLMGLILACVLLPFWTSVLARTAAWAVLLQREGLINKALIFLGFTDAPLSLLYTEGAVVLGMTHVMLPFMIVPIYGALKNIPDDYMRAAAVLGAPRIRSFYHVLLPLALPGIWSGCLLVFLTAMGFFVTPALLGSPREMMISTLIAQQIREHLDWPLASALVGVLTLIALGLVAVVGKALNFDRLMGATK